MHLSAATIQAAAREDRLEELAALAAHVITQEHARAEAHLNRFAGNPLNEALPLRDDGEDFAIVEANIPSAVAMAVETDPNFGPAYLKDPSGMKDFLKHHPQCRVKTVSGKIQSGYGSKRPARNRVVFGRNTITFAT